MAHTDEHRDKNEASASCSDLNLAGLYTSRAVKLCGLRMRLNSIPNHEVRARIESWQQSRSRKSGCRHENIEEPRWFADV